MKAIVIDEKEKAKVIEVDKPIPKGNEVLIKVEKGLICTWEKRIFMGKGGPLPFIPGHEIAGRIAEVPDGLITNFKVGDLVTLKTLNNCGHCKYCYTGNDNLCTGVFEKKEYSGIATTGGFCEYIAMDITRVYPFYGDDLEVAAFSEPVACCLGSIEKGDATFGDTVVIVGGGMMGQLHNILSLKRGNRTILVEPEEKKRQKALELGASVVIDPINEDPIKAIKELTNNEGADVIYITTSLLKIAEIYMEALAKTGKVIYYGSFSPDENISINPNKIHYGEYSIIGTYSPNHRTFYRATKFLSYDLIDIKKLISGRYTMDECQKAFEASLNNDNYRILISFE